ncbi:MarR family protein [Ruegeria conchae]|uniref:MarR family protein n=2 Tax=Ruegeria conchae TaxID=981384 RepID=A0A497YXR9_9RHOB|nr:MarR family protein [Ruegeria conchae]
MCPYYSGMEHRLDQLYQAVQAARPLLRNITAAVEQGSQRKGVTVGQRALLEGLSLFPGATAPVLCAKLQLKRQYVSRILKELMSEQLIESQPNSRRAGTHCYRLSPSGDATITAIRADEMTKLSCFAQDFSASELAAYHKVQLALTRYFADLAKDT